MKKILLAEHDSFLINIYANEFRKLGHNIIVATDGKMVVNRIKSINPDLLILDAALPKIDGFNVLKTLREDNSFKELKTIMLSNFSKEDDEKNDLGIIRHFIKAENTAEEIACEIKRILN